MARGELAEQSQFRARLARGARGRGSTGGIGETKPISWPSGWFDRDSCWLRWPDRGPEVGGRRRTKGIDETKPISWPSGWFERGSGWLRWRGRGPKVGGRRRTKGIDETKPISWPSGWFDRDSGWLRWRGRGERGPVECCALRRWASICLRDDMELTEFLPPPGLTVAGGRAGAGAGWAVGC